VPRLVGATATAGIARRPQTSLDERLQSAGADVAAVAERLRILASEAGLSVVSSANSLRLTDHLGAVVLVYPTYRSLEFPLDFLSWAGREAEIDGLREALQQIAGDAKKVSAKVPNIGCREALASWDAVSRIVYRLTRIRAEQTADTTGTTARSAGSALAAWHTGTAFNASIRARYDNEIFIKLRTQPFYATLLPRHPALADCLGELANELLATQWCLVHGDFSPKNILADGARISVVDWEVAHCGDPVFDLAFLTAHLLLKAIRRPADLPGYRALAAVFLDTYMDEVAASLRRPDDYLAAHVACLLLARVDGKSSVEYLTDDQRSQARELACSALTARAPSSACLWRQLDDSSP
jgi:hypothetical protein